MSIFSQHFLHFGNRKRAFTLIELLVVVTIITIITLVLLLQQSKFDSSTLLGSAAYSVAVSVRQAQLYGVSVLGTSATSGNCINSKAPTGTANNCFASGYGLYITPGKSYILFADTNNDGVYDAGDTVIKTFTLSGYTIRQVCAINGPNNYCSYTGSGFGLFIHSLTIEFERPNPDACITTDLNPPITPFSCASLPSQYGSAYIQLSAPNGVYRGIVVSTTGQINVDPPGVGP